MIEAAGTGTPEYVKGLENRALGVRPTQPPTTVSFLGDQLRFNTSSDFSVAFWIKTTMESSGRAVVLSNRECPDNSLASQKQKGWAFFLSGGTWAWSLGSGGRRFLYERDNGQCMPVNDGRWHQLAMTFDHAEKLIRLYYDGVNRVTYNVHDDLGFDFASDHPLVVGWAEAESSSFDIFPGIIDGQQLLQRLVDEFNQFGFADVQPDDLMQLATGPVRLAKKMISASSPEDRESLTNALNEREKQNFPNVFEFHKPRIAKANSVPILFAGDFNAVPHTDGGQSPASEALLNAGFVDAFRESYPDSRKHPGPTHEGGKRIDQLYYLGSGLRNRSTEVISTWPAKFPSDHFLIRTVFDLEYATSGKESK